MAGNSKSGIEHLIMYIPEILSNLKIEIRKSKIP